MARNKNKKSKSTTFVPPPITEAATPEKKETDTARTRVSIHGIENALLKHLEEGARTSERRLSNVLAPVSSVLEKGLATSVVNRKLDSRPDSSELTRSGILKNEHVANTLQGRVDDMDKKVRRSSLLSNLEHRPNLEQMKASGVLKHPHSNVENLVRRSSLHKQLSERSSLDELKARGVVKSQHADLETKIRRDSLKHNLDKRPEPKELENQGILLQETGLKPDDASVPSCLANDILSVEENIAPSIQQRRQSLSRGLMSIRLNKALAERPPREEVVKNLPRRMSQVLAPNKDKLEHKMRQDQMRAKLSAVVTNRHKTQFWRSRYAIALKAAAHLYNLGIINKDRRGTLKDLVLAQDIRVMAAVEVFEIDKDVGEMLDTLVRILNLGVSD